MLSIAHCSIMAGSNENKEFIFCAILSILRNRFESIQRMLWYLEECLEQISKEFIHQAIGHFWKPVSFKGGHAEHKMIQVL